MDVRTRTEEIERLTLAPWATFSDESRGRQRPEEQDPIRPVFQRDRDRVLHCKAFRRLKQKTQVFLSPEGDLYRTRLTHTLEVSQIARTIARALRLNEDLTEAISLAHDLGTELDARRQRCSVTVLLCEEQGFLLHRQTRIHLAENREVFATVAQDTRFNGVLAVRHIIPAIAEADFRFVRRIFIEVSCNQLNALTLDAPLIKLARVD